MKALILVGRKSFGPLAGATCVVALDRIFDVQFYLTAFLVPLAICAFLWSCDNVRRELR